MFTGVPGKYVALEGANERVNALTKNSLWDTKPYYEVYERMMVMIPMFFFHEVFPIFQE